jgi:hypothetical protein
MILFPKDLVALRTAYTLVDGEWTAGQTSSVPFTGEIQPMTNRDSAALNIGQSDLGKVTVFSDTELAVKSMGGQAFGDRVSFGGNSYELIKDDTYDNGIIDHYEYVGELRQ